MFSTTIKRSVATLGVVAGLLAAAGPASADTLNGGTRGDRSLGNPVTSDRGANTFFGGLGNDTLDTGASFTLDVATSEVFELNTFGGNDTLDARGTQVGSEGAKAPTKADDQMKVSGYNAKAAAVVVLIGANDYGLADTSRVEVASRSR